MRLALVTAIAAFALDEDLAPLRDALEAAGAEVAIVAWDDPTVGWSRFDAALLRSTWDYTERLDEFLGWCGRVSSATRLLNPAALVRWNTDKHYLADLERADVPVIPSHFIAPGEAADGFPAHAEFVVKPCVGAGSRDTQRYTADHRASAVTHVQRLLAQGRHVLVQPYLAQVDSAGETALIFFRGLFSHAIRKGPLLQPNGAATSALFAPEAITPREPSAAEIEVAHRALAAIPGGAPLYARVDLLPGEDGPRLLELELTEPSLFFDHAPGSAQRFAAAIVETVQRR
jgi:glutathione synthase/RimK-type ligase-like ATP-grasp enzyme